MRGDVIADHASSQIQTIIRNSDFQKIRFNLEDLEDLEDLEVEMEEIRCSETQKLRFIRE